MEVALQYRYRYALLSNIYLSFLRPDGDRDVVASPVDDELVPLAVHDGGVGDDLHGTGAEIQSNLDPKSIIMLRNI